MIDHIGFPVSDNPRAKAFHTEGQAPPICEARRPILKQDASEMPQRTMYKTIYDRA